VGSPYDLDVIKAERNRIDGRLKEVGYYYFNPDFIKVQVDSTVGTTEVDLIVKVKEETPPQSRNVYTINDIYIYPNFTIRRDTVNVEDDDIVKHKDFTIIDKKDLFNPRVFERTMSFQKGDLYNRTDHNLSLNRLVNLGTFKFVKNQFRPADSLENSLDAYYFLTPLTKKSIRVELLGTTNSANYTGSELNINWSNRNTFKGAELLTISAFGGVEVQVSGQNQGFNVYRVGAEANLIWPRFISPFRFDVPSGFVPRTKATLGYEFQFREQLYALSSLRAQFGYLWKENIRKEHQFNITEINYVRPINVTELYLERVAQTPALGKVIERQLIFGPTYSYTYTNTMQTAKTHTIYYKGALDLSGNAAGLISGANIRKGDTVKVFNVPFSQYIRAENEFRHYMKLGLTSQLASRIIVGTGYGYGNSDELPFIKQFFIGGTNSVRAFRARSIGPGTFREDTDENSFLPDQSGDLKLELNTELRAKLVSVVHGALFVDAGNIWLVNEDPEKPGGKISKDFLKELAVGTGAGLRFDLSFLVLRLDLAFPLRKPYLPENDRWVFDQIDFGSKGWRKENLVFNLAIGYPF
ncbi:MAG TPA: BamA/TamA family outer membrane protein, partial [Flavobacterium sp.]|nr:BamA/TamA family outer membrane protein [Flavobacterium sp.]